MSTLPSYSSFGSRLGATILDSIVVVVVTFPVLHLAYGADYWESDALVYGPLDLLLSYVLPAIYWIGMWHLYQATLGKKLLKQVIVDARTLKPAALGQLVVRYLAYYPAALCFGLGLLWVAFDKRKQGWHDKLARTVVIDAG